MFPLLFPPESAIRWSLSMLKMALVKLKSLRDRGSAPFITGPPEWPAMLTKLAEGIVA